MQLHTEFRFRVLTALLGASLALNLAFIVDEAVSPDDAESEDGIFMETNGFAGLTSAQMDTAAEVPAVEASLDPRGRTATAVDAIGEVLNSRDIVGRADGVTEAALTIAPCSMSAGACIGLTAADSTPSTVEIHVGVSALRPGRGGLHEDDTADRQQHQCDHRERMLPH